MAYRVIWEESARHDVDETLEYLYGVLCSAQAVDSFLERLESAWQIIAALPESGTRIHQAYLRHRDYRKMSVGKYLLVYRVAEHWASIEDGEVNLGEGIDGRHGVVRIVHLRHVTEDWLDEV